MITPTTPQGYDDSAKEVGTVAAGTESTLSAPIVCFSGSDWWYHNRGLFVPQIMVRLSQITKVLYINSLGMRVPSIRTDRKALYKIGRKLTSIGKYIRKVGTSMYVFSPISLPVSKNEMARRWNTASVRAQTRMAQSAIGIREPIYYVNCPPAWEAIKQLKRRALVYERTDIFAEMPGVDRDFIARLDRELVEAADLVLYVNRAMWAEGIKQNPNSMLIGHGVDYERFASAEKDPHIPDDIRSIPRPILGFFGDISDKTSDISLLEHTARSLPNASLVLIGSVSADVTELRSYSNVYFLGKKPYEEIPHYGKAFDVAIMPWNQNRWIEFCNPVKTKEYLALGNPIVTMHYPEVEPYRDLVYIAKDHKEFVEQLERAIGEDDFQLRTRRRSAVSTETWESKVRMIVEHLEQSAGSRQSAQDGMGLPT
jgi:glycosyltransferase involved in cell wall biosynthesis